MLRILWNSRAGMAAQQEKLDAISNNMANVSTDGYKRVDVSFQDTMQETLDRKGYPISTNANRTVQPYTGTGVKTGAWERDDRQGDLQNTSENTDLAIDGAGMFKVIRSDGTTAYTRSGNFNIDVNGTVTDESGNRLSIAGINGGEINATNGPNKVSFAKDNFFVDSKGVVSIHDNNQTVEVGRLNVFGATGQDAFRSIGNGLYALNNGAQEYVEGPANASIRQGFLEVSNVDVASEMTDMILTQKAFELNSRGLKTADEMWGMVNNLRGK